MNLQHFHSEKDDCDIFVKYKKKFGVVHRVYTKCKTHHKMICHCGWEIGFHFGECSKKLYPKGHQDLTRGQEVV
jgi:hypothetical protein